MSHFLAPVIALVFWSLIIWVLMYMRRIPAMTKLNIPPDSAQTPDSGWKSQLPLPTQWAAHNYNHLMEQPTVFYALMFAAYLMEMTSPLLWYCAWGYVALRVIHSLVQVTINKVIIRFSLFAIATILLIIMVCSVVAKMI